MTKAEQGFEDVYSEPIIGRGEGYLDNVHSCIKIGDSLFAEVRGSSLYKVKVDLNSLEGECSCPYQYNCKHAVAAYLYFKKGKGVNADKFISHLGQLDKKELIRIIISALPEKPELVSNYVFRKKGGFDSIITDLIEDFTIRKMEQIEGNLDCLSFAQLLKIADFVRNSQDDIFEKVSENYEYSDGYDDEGQFLDDFESKVHDEIIKKVSSAKDVSIILKKGYLHESIIDDADRFFQYKDAIKKNFSKVEYVRFLLNCKSPDMDEIKDNMVPDAKDFMLRLPHKNLALAERLADFLDDYDLRFMVAYEKGDLKTLLRHFDQLNKLVKMYLPINPSRIADMLIKEKTDNAMAVSALFDKRFFKDYSERHMKYLTGRISDVQALRKNLVLAYEFSKIVPIIERLDELRFDIKQLFHSEEFLKNKHWTEIVEIIKYIRKKLGSAYLEKFITSHKAVFATSSTLKSNLKSEGIIIQTKKGQFIVEIT